MISSKGLSQDIIIKNDKTEIKSKVIELTNDLIKYKKKSMLNGPIYSINKSEVFMIVYKNGKKEYIETKVKEKLRVNPTEVLSTKNSDVVTKANNKTSEVDNKIAAFNSNSFNSNPSKSTTPIQSALNETEPDKLFCIIGTDQTFSVYDINVNFPLKNHFYLGLGGFIGTKFYSIYGNLGYKMPLSKEFSVYTNAGYGYTKIDTPSVSSSGFGWNLGANYVFSNGWGITVYSPNVKGIMFGIVF